MDQGKQSIPETPCCSFCGRSQNDVISLIAGPNAFICDSCIERCTDISRPKLERDLDNRATSKTADWLGRTNALRWMIEALSSADVNLAKPIRGPWLMRVYRDTSDGSVRIVLRRDSQAEGDISISFTETADNLIEIAEWVAAAREKGTPSPADNKWVEEGVDMSLSISAKAILREHERIAEQLNLDEFFRSPKAEVDRRLTLDVDLVRAAIGHVIERNPNHRRQLLQVLRDLANELALIRLPGKGTN